MEEISPNIYAKEYFLSVDECQILINSVSERLEPSTVSTMDGKKILHRERTSYGAYFEEKEFPKLAEKIRSFISSFTKLPFENQEKLTVLRYEKDQQFTTHHDCFSTECKYIKYGGQRVVSVIIYLNQEFEGGETRFPMFNFNVVPKTGMIVIWNNMINGRVNSLMKHAGKPVKNGIKWIITTWVRENKFEKENDRSV